MYIYVSILIYTNSIKLTYDIIQAPTVSMREYGHWREVGVAFQLRDDAPYENTNRTLASGSVIKHVMKTRMDRLDG